MNRFAPSARAFADLSRPPFVAVSGQSPAAAAEEIVACFRRVAEGDARTLGVFTAAARAIGLAADDPLVLAGTRIAAEIDTDGAGMAGNAYHNSQHLCEVLLVALFLARQARLSPQRQARIVLAALLHDFHHDGSAALGPAFRLERQAVQSALPHLIAVGMAPDTRAAIASLVLATEITQGAPHARNCFRFLHLGGPVPGSAADLPEALGRLCQDPELSFDAVLLAEADLLPSLALTFEHGMLCQQRLSHEDRRIAPGLAAKQAFLDDHSELLVAGFFAPNLRRLREVVAAALAGQGS